MEIRILVRLAFLSIWITKILSHWDFSPSLFLGFKQSLHNCPQELCLWEQSKPGFYWNRNAPERTFTLNLIFTGMWQNITGRAKVGRSQVVTTGTLGVSLSQDRQKSRCQFGYTRCVLLVSSTYFFLFLCCMIETLMFSWVYDPLDRVQCLLGFFPWSFSYNSKSSPMTANEKRVYKFHAVFLREAEHPYPSLF